ncbi:MAG: tRNA (N6-threonylcarbamoyladenosine(37)-N6)-methyltransferase TrmO [Clostridia bacterium]|nr:tRNA (N6-threonylcarbamoyladenosine(37)-N6)-methyltransferase TrmO [Clostridia bacterium]
MQKELFPIKQIAYIRSDFKEKFGIPRQSGRAPLKSEIVFLPEYRTDDALREIERFSHLWILFDFSLAHKEEFNATVRPPRLGGNTRVGVFASRSPFRPNPIGLSCVRLIGIEKREEDGSVLIVEGADLLDGTPIIDIKPYLPSADCIPDAVGGYTEQIHHRLEVVFPKKLLANVPDEKRNGLIACLSDDPRPSYQDDPERIYGMRFAEYEIKFTVNGNTLTVVQVL